MIKTITRRLLILVLFCTVSNIALCQTDSTANLSAHHLGINWNAGNLIHDYPTWQMGLQYLHNNSWGLEAGVGVVTNSEAYKVSDEYMDHRGGFRLHGEARYFINLGSSKRGFYVGIGYAYLESTFQTDYVLRKEIQGERYFQNVDKEYRTTLNQYYVKVGHRFWSTSHKFFLETGFNLGYTQKSITPDIDTSGQAMTNKGFVNDFKRTPDTIMVDLKLGLMVF